MIVYDSLNNIIQLPIIFSSNLIRVYDKEGNANETYHDFDLLIINNSPYPA